MRTHGIHFGVGLVLTAATIAASASMIAAAGEVTYTKDIKPVMAQKCGKCHGAGAPTLEEFKKDKDAYKKKSKGPKMDSYASVMTFVNGSDAGAIMRRLDDGKSSDKGKAGNMYKFLGANDEERQKNLAQFKAWIGGWNLKRKAELTADELKAVAARE
jgi:hypothetical protein